MSSVLKLSTSLAALLVGLTVANAQTQEIRPGQDGQGSGQQMERKESGSGQQDGGATKERRSGQDGAGTEQRQGSTERQQGASDDKSEKRQRTGQGGDTGETKQRTGQSQDGDRKNTEQKAQGQSEDGNRTERNAQGQDSGTAEQRTSRDSTNGDSKKRPNVNITQEKKTVIRERVVQKAPKRYTRNEINFNLSVGTSVPDTFVIYDMPSAIIEVVPEYRDYDYIVVGDLLLIIDPDTREIVDVVQV
jgi:hypothetical protein